MEESFKDFIKRIKKVSGPRKHKISGSYGVYDAYKYYRKWKKSNSKFRLNESQYFNIIRTINNMLIDSLLEGEDIVLPLRMGKIELRKYYIYPRINSEGKIIYPVPIDWGAVFNLWYEDEEAMKEKTLVKIEKAENFKIFYNKTRARYTNQSYYFLNINRTFKRRVNEAANLNKLEAFKIT